MPQWEWINISKIKSKNKIMADFTTQYMGLYLKNPIVAASSSYTSDIKHLKELEKNGVSAVVLKSIFEEEILNGFNESLDLDDRFNSSLEFLDYYDYELKQESLDKYIQLIEDAKEALTIPVIASINCIGDKWWINYTKDIEQAGADAIEVNLSYISFDENDELRKLAVEPSELWLPAEDGVELWTLSDEAGRL